MRTPIFPALSITLPICALLSGRAPSICELGIHQREIFEGARGNIFGFAVRRLEIDFLKPARMDDLLKVATSAARIGGASINLVQRVFRGEVVLAEAKVLVACIANGRVIRLPLWVREKLADAV